MRGHRDQEPIDQPAWIDRAVRDRSGQLLGVVIDVYDDPLTRLPAWLALSTGFFGVQREIAPIAGASILGDDVVVAHELADIHGAPRVDIRVSVTEADERRLTDYFSGCDISRRISNQQHKGIVTP
ncbi:MAG: PRC-barrel domain-containing protein [Ilumatobacteraceae bacterium]